MKTKFTKDSLTHIADHGLATEFADVQRQTLMAELSANRNRSPIKLTGGQSTLTIQTVGNVTFTIFYDSVGHRGTSYGVHYFDPCSGLKFSVGTGNRYETHGDRALNSEDRSEAVAFLWRAILGNSPLSQGLFRRGFGEAQDETRAFLRRHAWVIMGEAGLRAKAIEASQRVSLPARNLQLAKDALRSEQSKLDACNRFDYAERLKAIEGDRDWRLKSLQAKIDHIALVAQKVGEAETVEGLVEVFKTYSGNKRDVGVFCRTHWSPNVSEHIYTYYFPQQNVVWSLPERATNYKMSIDGERINLSSGIVCPFTVAQALQWLRDGAKVGALQTNYGPVTLENTHENGTPYVAVRCGCHMLNPARDLGGEFAELLAPKHTVDRTEGVPELRLSEETFTEFKSRLLANTETFIAKRQADARQLRLRAIETIKIDREFASRQPSIRAEHEAKIVELTADVVRCQNELERFNSSIVGATLGQVTEQAKQILFALLPSSEL